MPDAGIRAKNIDTASRRKGGLALQWPIQTKYWAT